MKKIIWLILLIACVAGMSVAKSFETGYEPDGLDELTKEKGIFKTTLINPEADFSRYSGVYLGPVELIVTHPGAEPLDNSTGRLLGGRERKSVIPEVDEVVEFKRIVAETITTELDQKTDLELATYAGPNTLVLRPVVTDVVIISSSKNKNEDGHEWPELSYGTIVFDLIDGESGMIVARFGERRKCKPPKGAEERSGLWPNLAYWAECAGADLARELERVQAGGSSNQSS